MKLSKKLACLVLAVLMAIPAVSMTDIPAATTVEAASTKKATLYVGEDFYITGVKKITSSNKKVVKAKAKSRKGYVTVLKKGKVTLDVTTTYGDTYTYNVTVKEAALTATAQLVDSGILVSVTNGTKQTFEAAAVTVGLLGADGSIVDYGEIEVDAVNAKKTAFGMNLNYDSYTIKKYNEAADPDIVGVQVYGVRPVVHDFRYKYSDVSEKINTVSSQDTSYTSGFKVAITSTNTNKKYTVDGRYTVIYFDAAGNVVDATVRSFYMSKKGGSYATSTTSTFSGADNIASYAIITNAYILKKPTYY